MWDRVLTNECNPGCVVPDTPDIWLWTGIVDDYIKSWVNRATTQVYEGINEGLCLHNLAPLISDYVLVSVSPKVHDSVSNVELASFT